MKGGKKSTTKITLSSKELIQMQKRNQSFTDKQKIREFSTTKPALQQMLKELLYTGSTKERKALQNQIQNNKVNGNRIIHINNYLECKWTKCSNEKT